MATKNDQIISILRQILSSKDILFGAFSEKLTKEIKVAEWNKLTQSCQSMGLIKPDKGYAYVRDTFWSNIKRATLVKKDNARKTGAAGGKNQQLTSIDELVLEILGQDSPIVEGIGVQDSMGVADLEESVVTEDVYATAEKYLNQVLHPERVNFNIIYSVKFITKGSKAHSDLEDEKKLKRRKLKLQVEFLEINNYKKKLEVLALEQSMNVPRSNFTIGIHDIHENNAFEIV